MWKATLTEEDLRRYRQERERADRQYNDALSALDTALHAAPRLPSPPPTYDASQLAPLNDLWRVAAHDPAAATRGWRRRAAGFVWRLVGPILQQQQTFNAALVDHLNRNAPGDLESRRTLAEALSSLAGHFASLEQFEARLIEYLQQITWYVDTKDRDEAAMIRDRVDRVNHRATGLAAGLSGLADDLRLRWESMVAREQRFETRVSAVQGAYDELRTTLATLQQVSTVLRREVHQLLERESRAGAAAAPAPAVGDATGPRASDVAESVDAYKYVGFENLFRGTREEIRRRQADYLSLFVGASDVLDLGCGRGEFLELLREEGIPARGVDLNDEMVEVCRERGLDVVKAEALAYLAGLPDGQVGGIIAAQMIEHLEPTQLLRLLDVAHAKLRPGGRIVLETINPRCWFAFFESYIRDLTHVRPVHPDTLKYLMQASGFHHVEIRYRAPFPESDKLQPIPVPAGDVLLVQELPMFRDLTMAFNENVEKLNGFLFTHLDYAAVGARL